VYLKGFLGVLGLSRIAGRVRGSDGARQLKTITIFDTREKNGHTIKLGRYLQCTSHFVRFG